MESRTFEFVVFGTFITLDSGKVLKIALGLPSQRIGAFAHSKRQKNSGRLLTVGGKRDRVPNTTVLLKYQLAEQITKSFSIMDEKLSEIEI